MRKKFYLLAFALLFGESESFAFGNTTAGTVDSLSFANRSVLKGSKVKGKPQMIWMNGGQLFRKEIQLGYERFVTDWLAVELTGGYKFSVSDKQAYDISLPSIVNLSVYDYAERIPFSEGILASLGFRFYSASKRPEYARTYISPQFFYRNRSFDHKQINITTEKNDDSRHYDGGLQSLDLEIYGVKFLLGRTISLIDFSEKHSLLVDLYGGFGYRIKKATINFYDYDRNFPPPSPYYRPQVQDHESSLPSLQLGFKLGYQF